MKRLIGFILFLILFMVSTEAHAILINLDRYNTGDRLITSDTITGLEWLDVTETQGMSYRDVRSDTTLDNEGWRYATNFEVGDLFDTYLTVGNLGQMQGFFGVTSTVYDPNAGDRRYTHGFVEFVDGSGEYGTPYGDAVIIRYVSGGTSSWFTRNYGTAWNPGYSELTGGNWLVRQTPEPNPVPEPSTIILVGTALFGMFAFGRKKLFKK